MNKNSKKEIEWQKDLYHVLKKLPLLKNQSVEDFFRKDYTQSENIDKD